LGGESGGSDDATAHTHGSNFSHNKMGYHNFGYYILFALRGERGQAKNQGVIQMRRGRGRERKEGKERKERKGRERRRK